MQTYFFSGPSVSEVSRRLSASSSSSSSFSRRHDGQDDSAGDENFDATPIPVHAAQMVSADRQMNIRKWLEGLYCEAQSLKMPNDAPCISEERNQTSDGELPLSRNNDGGSMESQPLTRDDEVKIQLGRVFHSVSSQSLASPQITISFVESPHSTREFSFQATAVQAQLISFWGMGGRGLGGRKL